MKRFVKTRREREKQHRTRTRIRENFLWMFRTHYWAMNLTLVRDDHLVHWVTMEMYTHQPTFGYYSVYSMRLKAGMEVNCSCLRFHSIPSSMDLFDNDRHRYDNLYWPRRHFHHRSRRHRSIARVSLSIPTHWSVDRLEEEERMDASRFSPSASVVRLPWVKIVKLKLLWLSAIRTSPWLFWTTPIG